MVYFHITFNIKAVNFKSKWFCFIKYGGLSFWILTISQLSYSFIIYCIIALSWYVSEHWKFQFGTDILFILTTELNLLSLVQWLSGGIFRIQHFDQENRLVYCSVSGSNFQSQIKVSSYLSSNDTHVKISPLVRNVKAVYSSSNSSVKTETLWDDPI